MKIDTDSGVQKEGNQTNTRQAIKKRQRVT